MSEYQTGSEQNTRQISNPKIVLSDSFARNLTCYHAQIWRVENLDDFQKLRKM